MDDQAFFGNFGGIPPHLITKPLLRDELVSQTSELQHETIEECLPLLHGVNDPRRNPFDFDERGVPNLHRDEHLAFCQESLGEFPARFVGVDASRPWMIYWVLTSLHLLGKDVSRYRSSVVKTFAPLQNSTGGFGGGHGHLSHLAATYAALLSIALVGGIETYALVDRYRMWTWLGRLKEVDGGFRICEDGEEDVRGAYCALVAISLLGLPWELPVDAPARRKGLTSFADGLGRYLSRCQTYEGGVSASPGNEAHGAYAFCALACSCLLGRPDESMAKSFDLDMLLSWLSARQYAPEGGFAGRTNKLVDGCYSHWIGGCWPLLQAALGGDLQGNKAPAREVRNLFETEGLVRYILGCCQAPGGGLRDKPSKRPDAYHTCYNLVGLSSTENYHYFVTSEAARTALGLEEERPGIESVTWRTGPDDDFRPDAGLKALHPVFIIPHQAVDTIRAWSLQQKPLEGLS